MQEKKINLQIKSSYKKSTDTTSEQLIKELLILIFKFLDNHSLAMSTSVNRSWYFLSKKNKHILVNPRAKNYIDLLARAYIAPLLTIRGPDMDAHRTMPTYSIEAAAIIANQLSIYKRRQVGQGKINLAIASANEIVTVESLKEIARRLIIQVPPLMNWQMIFPGALAIAITEKMAEFILRSDQPFDVCKMSTWLVFLLASIGAISAAAASEIVTDIYINNFTKIQLARLLGLKTIITNPSRVIVLEISAYQKLITIPLKQRRHRSRCFKVENYFYSTYEKISHRLSALLTKTIDFIHDHPVLYFLLSYGAFHMLVDSYVCTANKLVGDKMYNAVMQTFQRGIHQGFLFVPYIGTADIDITDSNVCRAVFNMSLRNSYPDFNHCYRMATVLSYSNKFSHLVTTFNNPVACVRPSVLLVGGAARCYSYASVNQQNASSFKKTLSILFILSLLLIGLELLSGNLGLLNLFDLQSEGDSSLNGCARACNDGIFYHSLNTSLRDMQEESAQDSECRAIVDQSVAGVVSTAMAAIPLISYAKSSFHFFCKKPNIAKMAQSTQHVCTSPARLVMADNK